MEMRLRAPVTRDYFFLLGALRLVNAASPRNIDQKKISSGTQGIQNTESKINYIICGLKIHIYIFLQFKVLNTILQLSA